MRHNEMWDMWCMKKIRNIKVNITFCEQNIFLYVTFILNIVIYSQGTFVKTYEDIMKYDSII